MCCESDVYNDLFQSVKLLEYFSVDFFLSPKPISMKLLVVIPTLAAKWHQIDFRLWNRQ